MPCRLPFPLACAAALAAVASAASAAPGDDLTPAPFRGLCQMVETCYDGSGCIALPAPGALILELEGDHAWMGPSEENLTRYDAFSSLAAALPLTVIDRYRRRFLVALPQEDGLRRFALREQTYTAATGENVLREAHYVFACTELAP